MFTVICKTAEAAFNALHILARYWVDVEVQTTEPMPTPLGEIHLVVTQKDYEHNAERCKQDFQLAEEEFSNSWVRSTESTCPTCQGHLQVLTCGHSVFVGPIDETGNNSDEEAGFYEAGAELYQELTMEQRELFHSRMKEQYPNGCSWKATFGVLQTIS